jgi:hypothetical protein
MGHNLPKLFTKFDIPRPLATAKALGLGSPHDARTRGCSRGATRYFAFESQCEMLVASR